MFIGRASPEPVLAYWRRIRPTALAKPHIAYAALRDGERVLKKVGQKAIRPIY